MIPLERVVIALGLGSLAGGNSKRQESGVEWRIATISPRHRPGNYLLVASFSAACFTGGIFQLPSIIDGGFSFGQYSRSIRMNLSLGAGSQLASLSLPGSSFSHSSAKHNGRSASRGEDGARRARRRIAP